MTSRLIAAIHLPPSLSYETFPGRARALAQIERDARTVLDAGFDGILLENENDKPHTIEINKAQVAWLTEASGLIRRMTDKFVGINVQRIDWEATFAIAAASGLDFLRLDVFVDVVEMQGTHIELDPKKIRAYRSALKADEIEIWADVHVKHAKLLSHHTLTESAHIAEQEGAAAVLISGTRTGEPPSIEDLESAREGVKSAQVVIASGLNEANAASLARKSDAAIVGTSIKDGESVSLEKAKRLERAWNSARASRP